MRLLENQIIEKIISPPMIAEKDSFQIKIAEHQHEIEEAMRLRYDVFKMDQRQGMAGEFPSELDKDEFDDYCLHLIIKDTQSSKVVGTYRVHPGEIANASIGFYSAREFTISGLEHIVDDLIELGRSCVHPDFRNGAVVGLLWSGIANILKRSEMNFLLGCASLETTDPLLGWAVHEYMMRKGHISKKLTATTTEKYTLMHPGQEQVEQFLEQNMSLVRKSMPPLLKGYLRIGAVICGPPAVDWEFGSIDFLILFDLRKMPEKYVRHFC